MTATDEIRSLLDERGVEWFESVTRKGLTWIYRDGKAIRFHPWQPDTLKVSMFDLTPEQAVEVTLGPAARHPKPHEQWTTVLLPEIAWDWDDRWPDYLSVAHDAHGEWRVYVPEATLGLTGKVSEKDSDGRGECRNTEQLPLAWSFTCSECGVHSITEGERFNFCPNCGCKVVSE